MSCKTPRSPKRRREPPATTSEKNPRSSRRPRRNSPRNSSKGNTWEDSISILQLIGEKLELLSPLAEVLIIEHLRRTSLSDAVRISEAEKQCMREMTKSNSSSSGVESIRTVLGFSFRRSRSTHQELVFNTEPTMIKRRDQAIKDILIWKWRESKVAVQEMEKRLREYKRELSENQISIVQLKQERKTWQQQQLIARLNRNSIVVTMPTDDSRTEAQAIRSVLEQAAPTSIHEAVARASQRLGRSLFYALFQASTLGYQFVQEVCEKEQRDSSKDAQQSHQEEAEHASSASHPGLVIRLPQPGNQNLQKLVSFRLIQALLGPIPELAPKEENLLRRRRLERNEDADGEADVHINDEGARFLFGVCVQRRFSGLRSTESFRFWSLLLHQCGMRNSTHEFLSSLSILPSRSTMLRRSSQLLEHVEDARKRFYEEHRNRLIVGFDNYNIQRFGRLPDAGQRHTQSTDSLSVLSIPGERELPAECSCPTSQKWNQQISRIFGNKNNRTPLIALPGPHVRDERPSLRLHDFCGESRAGRSSSYADNVSFFKRLKIETGRACCFCDGEPLLMAYKARELGETALDDILLCPAPWHCGKHLQESFFQARWAILYGLLGTMTDFRKFRSFAAPIGDEIREIEKEGTSMLRTYEDYCRWKDVEPGSFEEEKLTRKRRRRNTEQILDHNKAGKFWPESFQEMSTPIEFELLQKKRKILKVKEPPGGRQFVTYEKLIGTLCILRNALNIEKDVSPHLFTECLDQELQEFFAELDAVTLPFIRYDAGDATEFLQNLAVFAGMAASYGYKRVVKMFLVQAGLIGYFAEELPECILWIKESCKAIKDDHIEHFNGNLATFLPEKCVILLKILQEAATKFNVYQPLREHGKRLCNLRSAAKADCHTVLMDRIMRHPESTLVCRAFLRHVLSRKQMKSEEASLPKRPLMRMKRPQELAIVRECYLSYHIEALQRYRRSLQKPVKVVADALTHTLCLLLHPQLTLRDVEAAGIVELESYPDAMDDFRKTMTKQAKVGYLHDLIEGFGESILVNWIKKGTEKSPGVLREEAKAARVSRHGPKTLLQLRLGIDYHLGYRMLKEYDRTPEKRNEG